MINSVRKAIAILYTFSSADPRLSLGEISAKLGMPKSTTHKMLQTLLALGFVEKVDGDRYALGMAVIPLTQSVRINVELRDRAAPLLRELADYARDSVYLTVPDGDYSLYIYAVESPSRLLARTAIGDRVLMHCTSLGKVMLAHLPSEEIDQIVARTGLPAYTPTTITDLEELHRQLDQIRRQGYAISAAEHEPDTYAVAAPIYDERGRMIAACCISGSDAEIIAGRVGAISVRVMYTAQEISRRMGYVPSSLAQAAASLAMRRQQGVE